MKKYRFRGIRKTRGEQEPLSRLTFRIDAKHLEELEEYARREGMTNSFLVRHLVMRFLESQRRPDNLPPMGV